MEKHLICISGKAEAGKTTLANYLDKKLDSLILNNGDHVKDIATRHYRWDGKKDEAGRSLLQWLGTDICRKNNPNIWVNVIKEDIKGLISEYDYFIIADCRFENEIEVLKQSFDNVITVRINRSKHISELTEKQLLHPSETSLDNFDFDYKVDAENIKDLENYGDKIIYDLERKIHHA